MVSRLSLGDGHRDAGVLMWRQTRQMWRQIRAVLFPQRSAGSRRFTIQARIQRRNVVGEITTNDLETCC